MSDEQEAPEAPEDEAPAEAPPEEEAYEPPAPPEDPQGRPDSFKLHRSSGEFKAAQSGVRISFPIIIVLLVVLGVSVWYFVGRSTDELAPSDVPTFEIFKDKTVKIEEQAKLDELEGEEALALIEDELLKKYPLSKELKEQARTIRKEDDLGIPPFDRIHTAKVQVNQKRYRTAISILNELLSDEDLPEHFAAEAHFIRGVCHGTVGAFDPAIADLDEALEKGYPKTAQAQAWKARFESKKKETDGGAEAE